MFLSLQFPPPQETSWCPVWASVWWTRLWFAPLDVLRPRSARRARPASGRGTYWRKRSVSGCHPVMGCIWLCWAALRSSAPKKAASSKRRRLSDFSDLEAENLTCWILKPENQMVRHNFLRVCYFPILSSEDPEKNDIIWQQLWRILEFP